MVRALGNTSSHLLCVEREVTEGKNIHRAEGGVKWLNWSGTWKETGDKVLESSKS